MNFRNHFNFETQTYQQNLCRAISEIGKSNSLTTLQRQDILVSIKFLVDYFSRHIPRLLHPGNDANASIVVTDSNANACGSMLMSLVDRSTLERVFESQRKLVRLGPVFFLPLHYHLLHFLHDHPLVS